MSDKFTLSFFITREDTLRASEHYKEFISNKNQSKKGLLWFLGYPLLWFIKLCFSDSFTFWGAVYETIIFTLVTSAAFSVLFAVAFILRFILKKPSKFYADWKYQRQLKKAALENHADRKSTQYTFTEDKVEILYEGQTDEHDWSIIDGIFEYPDGFLFLNKDKYIELLIPKRAFENDFKQKLFRNFAKRKFGEKATVNLFST